jgi:hypothetical protein
MHRGKEMQRLGLVAMMLAAAIAVAPDFARAQEGPGGFINPGRDCQTIRTCNFRKGGSYRGCLSSYSCRVCKLVKVSCKGLSGTCRQMRCGWGGVS